MRDLREHYISRLLRILRYSRVETYVCFSIYILLLQIILRYIDVIFVQLEKYDPELLIYIYMLQLGKNEYIIYWNVIREYDCMIIILINDKK